MVSHGIGICVPDFFSPAYVGQRRCNEVFSMENILLSICLSKLVSLELQFLGLTLYLGYVNCGFKYTNLPQD